MSCSVAVSSSPVFPLSSSIFYNKNSIVSPSMEPLTLSLPILNSTPSCSSPSSPSSPFQLVFPGSASPAPVSSTAPLLKRKRPTKLDIPVASLTFGVPAAPPSSPAERDVVEVEEHGFSVYCKRGRRERMEDRYSAAVDLHGEPKQVIKVKR